MKLVKIIFLVLIGLILLILGLIVYYLSGFSHSSHYLYTIYNSDNYGVVEIEEVYSSLSATYIFIEATDKYNDYKITKKLTNEYIYGLYEKNDCTISLIHGHQFSKYTINFIFHSKN